MARRVHGIALEAGVVPVILRCWSWPELACILLCDRPGPLLATARAIESTTIGTLRTHDPAFEQAFQAALRDHRVGREIARLWISGPPQEPHELADEPVVDLSLLDRRHAVVAAKSQIGILEPAWARVAGPLPACLQEVGERAFRRPLAPPPTGRAGRAGVAETGGVEADLDRYCGALEASRSPAGAAASPFVARISILVKPGHLSDVRRDLQRLAKSLPDELTLRTSVDGEGTTLLLFVQLPDEPLAFARLLAISHWLRVWEPLRPHILDVTTLFEECDGSRGATGATGAEDDEPTARREGDDSGDNGYGLLYKFPSDEARTFGRYRAKLKGLGRVESRSLHTWMAALDHTVSRPEMYGAMMELHAAASSAYSDIIYSREDHWRRHARLSDRVRELLRHGRAAYNQRLQFSPVMRGAPPISGQLPYGINQIVGMLDGLAASIIQVVRADDPVDPDSTHSTRTIVVFEPDAAIGTRPVLNLTILTVNLLQALIPVSLCLLFHEMGHALEHHLCDQEAVDPGEAASLDRQAWRESQQDTIERMADLYCDQEEVSEDEGSSPPDRDDLRRERQVRVRLRVRRFLEDIFPHTVWRRLGCGGDFDLFTTQFLAGQAMGLRTQSDPRDPKVSLFAWAETAVHLAIQQLLAEEGEDLDKVVHRLASGDDLRAALVAKLPKVLAYAATELGDAAIALGNSQAELQDSLRGSWASWISMLALVCGPELDGPKPYWRHLASLMERLAAIEGRIDRVEEGLRDTPGSGYRTIVEQVRAGEPAFCPWSVVSEDYRPTDEAFLWVRQILRAVTEDFEAGHRGGISLQSSRERALAPDGPRPPRPLEAGLYTDHTGGLTAVGREQRLLHLKVCNAAFESLWELTSRIMAGRIRRFLVRRRDFERIRSSGRARVRIGQKVANVPLCDVSPIGFSVGPAEALAGLGQGDRVEIERKDGRWLPSTVIWAADRDGPSIGAVLDGEQDQGAAPASTLVISSRLQMDPYWAKVYEP